MSCLLRCETNVSLASLSTFGIGGEAKYVFRAETVDDLRQCMSWVHKEGVPYIVVGRGSNYLFKDEGFQGVVILNRIEQIRDEGNGRFIVGGGARFPALGSLTAREGWGGLEHGAGIPGSVGGAVYMNAGAHQQQTGSVVSSVDYVDEQGNLVHLTKDELVFGYRTSSFRSRKGVIATVAFELFKNERALEKQKEMLLHRKKTQPLERSAGCIFRNPPMGSAGKLIEEAGLKGTKIGGAMVSPIHANFIVNVGGATGADVRKLLTLVQTTVQQKTGVLLAPEVICL